MYDKLHGRVSLPIDEFFETLADPNIRCHRFNFHQFSYLAGREVIFPNRLVKSLNKLLPEVVGAALEETFKLRLNGI